MRNDLQLANDKAEMTDAKLSDLWREAAELKAILEEMKTRGERVPIAIEEKVYVI